MALLNAIIYTIIEEDLYDKQYVSSMTEGFEALKNNISKFVPEEMEIFGYFCRSYKRYCRIYANSDKSIIFGG